MGNCELKKTVILANGEFPRKDGAAWNLLAGAKRVICCDGAADAYHRRFHRWPTVIIGDFDSVSRLSSFVSRPPFLVKVSDQDTNDLEKAMAYCAKQGWKNPVIVGATGKREDHTLGNVFRALDYGCEIVTDTGRFVPICGKAMFKTSKGAAVSVFATDPKTRMTSKGLQWPLAPVKFRNLYCATLNRATGVRFEVTSNRPVTVYVEEKE